MFFFFFNASLQVQFISSFGGAEDKTDKTTDKSGKYITVMFTIPP